MHWELEDQITHEAVSCRTVGEWRIGREFDPEATAKFFSVYQSPESDVAVRKKILIPITEDYEKCKKLLASFVLSKVSREHAIFGIDDQGPYIIDISTNGTTIRDEHGYKQCGKGMKCRLSDGIVIHLAANYPLLLKKRNTVKDAIQALRDFLSKPFRTPKDVQRTQGD